MNGRMDDETFYRQCADILGTTYDCTAFTGHARTRWNNRSPGGGRFPGCGIVRLFGDQVQIALRHPVTMQCNVEGRQAALDLIKDAVIGCGR